MKVTLHIGTEKTGTSSIQEALRKSRDTLAKKGILYPELFGTINHMEIAVACRQSSEPDELQIIEQKRFNGINLAHYRVKLQHQLVCEIEAGTFDRLILSNEHCHSRLRLERSMINLVRFLEPISSEIEILVYLRRQDRLAVSASSTRTRHGGQGILFPKREHPQFYYYQYDELLELYARHFGRDAITVRLFEKPLLEGGDAVEDFFKTAKLGKPPAGKFHANPSLSRAQFLFLNAFNTRFPFIKNGQVNPDRGDIVAIVKEVRKGAPFRPARADAEAFFAQFEEGNHWVKEQYFADAARATLFDEDFSSYSSAGDEDRLSEEEIFDFIEAIWMRKKKPL